MMKHFSRVIPNVVLLSVFIASFATAVNAAGPLDTLLLPDGSRLKGELKIGTMANPEFRAEFAQSATRLEPGMTLLFDNAPLESVSGIPPFRVELGRGQQISGRLEALTAERLTLIDTVDNTKIAIVRPGVQSLIQRPGEVQVFQDGFETIDHNRWSVIGEPTTVAVPKEAGEHSLRIPGGITSLTHQIENPFSSGRLELAFYDSKQIAVGQQWWVDLAFKSAMGSQSVRVLLGWSEESLGVESPGGAAFAVQRLIRKEGWHRLSFRFTSERCEISVDGNELALGKDIKGPLVEIRLASYQAGKAQAVDGLAGYVDDLRLIRHDEPVSGLEVDPTQDEVRLTQGDQVFGKDLAADADRVSLLLDGKPTTFGWSEISGLHLKRTHSQGQEIEGVLARVEWQAAPGNDARDRNMLEGALQEISPTTLTLQTAYAGTLRIPRNRLRSIKLIGNRRTHRIEIDPKTHHLGNDVSVAEPLLDPPQPEGGVLERIVELAKLPEGPAFLVIDAVQVVGETIDLPYYQLLKKGELRTNLKINGLPFDYLNRLVTSQNQTPERFRFAIPKDLLRIGKNRIRFEQVGNANDPNFLDDLGILGIALEFD